jgi:hypothetical protein
MPNFSDPTLTALQKMTIFPCRDIKDVNASLVERITPGPDASQELLLKIGPVCLVIPNIGKAGVSFRQFIVARMYEI